jgi:hypothetical protein
VYRQVNVSACSAAHPFFESVEEPPVPPGIAFVENDGHGRCREAGRRGSGREYGAAELQEKTMSRNIIVNPSYYPSYYIIHATFIRPACPGKSRNRTTPAEYIESHPDIFRRKGY